MRITDQVVVFDAADLAAESRFWAGVLGGTVDAEDDWHMELVDGRPRSRAPRLAPQQMHLDLWVDDTGAAHQLVMSLGATVLQPAGDSDTPDPFQVYGDPAGRPFCLCW